MTVTKPRKRVHTSARTAPSPFLSSPSSSVQHTPAGDLWLPQPLAGSLAPVTQLRPPLLSEGPGLGMRHGCWAPAPSPHACHIQLSRGARMGAVCPHGGWTDEAPEVGDSPGLGLLPGAQPGPRLTNCLICPPHCIRLPVLAAANGEVLDPP